MPSRVRSLHVCAALLAALSAPALAELPRPVRDMVDAAIATGDPEKVDTVIGIARQTNPDAIGELDALHTAFQVARNYQQEEQARAREQAVRRAGLLRLWSGSGEIGAFRSSGNSSDMGGTVALKLDREGIAWAHSVTAKVDFQRSKGETTREQYLLAYQPRYRINHRFFTYALGQFERDRFQGFVSRFSLSGGFGYQLVDEQYRHLSLEAGPAWRRTDLDPGGIDHSLGARFGLKADWTFMRNVTLVEEASAYIQPANSSLTSLTALDAGISDGLKARISYSIEHDGDPPDDAKSLDTLTRFTLIYGF